ncbi:PREDICTED: uncharacterized protein LOC108548258 [Eufriesea mexicana]|uniref:uncharacterized protein LOC108548258 n=1 Tax=Eufriesea mexicana TaxID=516756 RepID=UPI00083C78FB|nr:PREDICTED: uncharacterized protein LOC108548258 [Eufriesea mexicana]
MNLLLLSLAALALGIGATMPPSSTPEKMMSNGGEPPKVMADKKAQPSAEDATDDKEMMKRSYAWNPRIYVGYSYGWPWYGFAHGWYPGWPLYYGYGYGGYHGGYGGW